MISQPQNTGSSTGDITQVGVVGAGLMGAGIAEVCARAGLAVHIREVNRAAVHAGRRRIAESMGRAVRNHKMSDDDRTIALDRITITTEYEGLADLVVEAIAEDETAKVSVFTELDKVVAGHDAILATNTSSIPITKLGIATNRPEHVLGIHFFNPAPVLHLVEIVPSLLTDARTQRHAEDFVSGVRRKRVVLSRDRAGFVVNALLVPYLLAAVRMLESGFATADDVDTGMELGCAHPMGPLRLADLIGLDTVVAIAESMYEEFKEPLYAPPPMLTRMVDAGLLGKKAGRGFHSHHRSPAARGALHEQR